MRIVTERRGGRRHAVQLRLQAGILQIDPAHTGAQREGRLALTDYQRDACVAENVLQAFTRVGRVQRHVGCVDFPDGHDRHREGIFPARQYTQRRTQAAALAEQPMRQAVGPRVQFGITHRLLANP
ncbi:hypothetical protein D3C85_688190 [compost metagenome]